MIRHVVLVRYAEDAPQARRDELVAALTALRDTVPAVRTLEIGPTLGLAPGPWDLVLSVTCDDEAGWREYAQHPDHVEARKILDEVQAERTSVQFEI